MSLYSTPEKHAANPPETWTVERVSVPGSRPVFGIVIEPGKTPTETHNSRADAERAIRNPESWIRKLYEKESRWYAGEDVAGWRPWMEITAERDRDAQRAAERAAEEAAEEAAHLANRAAVLA